jgi:5'/3'-nucleotidase
VTKRILVTNDDGIHAPGIHTLAEALKPLGEVHIICPDRERSAVSHSFTMHSPLRVNQVGENVHIINGTPTDCVMFAILGYFKEKPDLVVSGINNGPNMGDDVIYSGTVAAAHEGKILGIPSFAISINSRNNVDEKGEREEQIMESSGRFGALLAEHIIRNGLPPGTFLNINVPNLPWDKIKGVSVTKLGQRVYNDGIVMRKDPMGKEYFWIGGDEPSWIQEQGTDFEALENDRISMTPLGQSLTGFNAMRSMEGMAFGELGESELPDGACTNSDHEMAKQYVEPTRTRKNDE